EPDIIAPKPTAVPSQDPPVRSPEHDLHTPLHHHTREEVLQRQVRRPAVVVSVTDDKPRGGPHPGPVEQLAGRHALPEGAQAGPAAAPGTPGGRRSARARPARRRAGTTGRGRSGARQPHRAPATSASAFVREGDGRRAAYRG